MTDTSPPDRAQPDPHQRSCPGHTVPRPQFRPEKTSSLPIPLQTQMRRWHWRLRANTSAGVSKPPISPHSQTGAERGGTPAKRSDKACHHTFPGASPCPKHRDPREAATDCVDHLSRRLSRIVRERARGEKSCGAEGTSRPGHGTATWWTCPELGRRAQQLGRARQGRGNSLGAACERTRGPELSLSLNAAFLRPLICRSAQRPLTGGMLVTGSHRSGREGAASLGM